MSDVLRANGDDLTRPATRPVVALEMVAAVDTIALWDDNPTLTDLLGIDTVVEAVATALVSPALDPVTVSVQSRWGGGKSSALRMIEAKFTGDSSVVVITVDPWEFEDGEDVRGTVISEVLTKLRKQHPKSFTDKMGGLLRRIAWKRVGMAVANSALTMSIKPAELIAAFTPEVDQPKGMAGFREAFAKVMADATGLSKVVVLVDDLDRCKPSSVVATLEAIKVFLAVPKMAFVLAAEEEMIRWSIAQDTHAGGRSEFADRYLEKIVQLPVTLPRLTQDAAETYITLLLCQKRCGDDKASYEGLVRHVADRRKNRQFPLIAGPHAAGVHKPDPRDLLMAALVARGLSSDQWSSPRAIKRFLNAWGVREAIALARDLTIEPDVSLKLYLLEHRFPTDFKALEDAPAKDRADFVRSWEAWGRGEDGAAKPEQLSNATREWAGSPPSLVDAMDQFDRYANLAASFTSFSAGSGLSDTELELLSGLAVASDVKRRENVDHVKALEPDARKTIVERLLTRLPSLDEPSKAIESACDLATSDPALAPVLCDGIRQGGLLCLDVGDVLEISRQVHTDEVLALLEEVAGDDRIDQGVREVATEEIEGWTSHARQIH